jgi:hypothetical protein
MVKDQDERVLYLLYRIIPSFGTVFALSLSLSLSLYILI